MPTDEADALFALPVEGFTKARDELARRLKQEGDEQAAASVKALRKPSVAAWALNQVARSRTEDVEALLQAGEEVRTAQQATLSGKGREKLQEATAARKRVIDRLVERAAEELAAAGRTASRALLDDVSATLTATATDPEVAEKVRRGVLEKEATPPSGFEELFRLQGPAPPARAQPSKGAKPKDDRARRAAEKAVSDRRDRADRMAREAQAAGAAAKKLDEEATKAERAAAGLRKEADAAARKADRSRRSADQARDELDEAERELEAIRSS